MLAMRSSMMQSLTDIQQMEYEDETSRQEKFKQLIDVSLEDLRYGWRDAGKKKYDEFMDNATQIARTSQGKLTWPQKRKIF